MKSFSKKNTVSFETALKSALEFSNDTWITWNYHRSVLIKNYNSKPSSLLLALDLDDTLIEPKNPKSKHSSFKDWKLKFNEATTRKRLEEYINNGYQLAIFSNQAGITTGNADATDIKNKIDAFQTALNLPFIVFLATEKDYYRKPSIGMFNLLKEMFNDGIAIDVEKSIFVGDAAGRPKTKTTKRDHSDSDYKFALNAKLEFKTPENFFLNAKMTDIPELKCIRPKATTSLFSNGDDAELTSEKQEMLVFVGPAGSGKSSFYHKNLKGLGYVHVNQDKLKTKEKCYSVTESALLEGKSVVIDCTLAEKAKRSEFIKLAKEKDIQVRCFLFLYDKEFVMHMNKMRSINPYCQRFSDSVMDVVIHTWYKYLEEPNELEGFQKVLKVNFVENFTNNDDKEAFYSYT